MTRLIRIYLAAPLFSESERRRNRELRNALVQHAEVFLPQEDGSLLMELVAHGLEPARAKHVVFEADVEAIKNCDIFLMVLDGRCIDEGACFELGLAYAFRKKCYGIKTDVRTLLSIGDNPMIECALERIFLSDLTAVSGIASLKQAS